jgi:hypothetical protein
MCITQALRTDMGVVFVAGSGWNAPLEYGAQGLKEQDPNPDWEKSWPSARELSSGFGDGDAGD